MPRPRTHRNKHPRPGARRRDTHCSYAIATIYGARGGPSIEGSIFVVPRPGTKRSTLIRYDTHADFEASLAFLKPPTRTPTSGYRRARRSSHCSGCCSNREYVPTGPPPTWQAYRGKAQNKIDTSKRRTRNDRSYEITAPGLRSTKERSRQRHHRRPSRAQQKSRYPTAPPPSHCSSSSESELVGRPRRDKGYIEPGSLISSQLPSPAPSATRRASTTDTLVEEQSLPTTLPPNRHGLLASRIGGVSQPNAEWDLVSQKPDSSSDSGSGYGLRLEGPLAARPYDGTSHSGPNSSSSSRRITTTGEFDLPARQKQGFLLRSRGTRPPSDISTSNKNYQTRPTAKSFFQRLGGSVKTLYNDLISLGRHLGNTSKGRATPSESVNRSSKGSDETDGRSKEIRGVADCPLKLPELDKTDYIGEGQTGRTWADEAIGEFSTCTGDREPEYYVDARKKLNLDE